MESDISTATGMAWSKCSEYYWLLFCGGGLVTKSCPILETPWTVTFQAPLWDSPGKNTGVGCHFLLS